MGLISKNEDVNIIDKMEMLEDWRIKNIGKYSYVDPISKVTNMNGETFNQLDLTFNPYCKDFDIHLFVH